jgi:hypothetical protein
MNNLTVSRHLDCQLKITAPDGKEWTARLEWDRICRIRNGAGRTIKLDGPTGKRIAAAFDDFLDQCADELPAALDEYVQALNGSDADARTSAWRRCEHLGASYNDYILARRRAEGNAVA